MSDSYRMRGPLSHTPLSSSFLFSSLKNRHNCSTMTTFVLRDLQTIAQDHRLTHHDQEGQILQLIQRDHGDIVRFLLTLQPAPFHEVLDTLRKYLDIFNEIILHPDLPRLFSFLRGHPELLQSVKTLLELCKWDARKNLSRAIVDYQANLQHLFDFSLVYFAGDDLEAAEKAKEVLVIFIQAAPAQFLPRFREASMTYKASPSSSNYTILLRYYSLVADVSRDNEALCLAAQAAGLLEDLVSLLRCNDLLVLINVLDLLVPIASSNAGLEALSGLQVIKWLVDSLREETDAFGGALRDEALRALSALFSRAAKHSMLFIERQHPSTVELFLRTVGDYIEGGVDESTRIAGLAALADFASISVHSLELALTFQNRRLVQEWLRLLLASKPEMQGAVLGAVAKIIHQDDAVYVDNERAAFVPQALGSQGPEEHVEQSNPAALLEKVHQLKRALLLELDAFKRGGRSSGSGGGGGLAPYLLHCARHPVACVKMPALDILACLASSAWGVALMLGAGAGASISETAVLQSEIFVFLENRLSETSKEGRERKFSILVAWERGGAFSLMPSEVQRRIQRMVSQGPFYKPAALEEMQTM